MKCVALISGGKDSWYNAMQCVTNGHQIIALANLRPPSTSPDEMDSFMYQTVGHDTIDLQAECIGLPLYREYITGQSVDQTLNYSTTPGDETEDLFRLLSSVKARHPDIQAVSAGAILSNYQRIRVENVCARLGLTCLAYLWQQDQQELLAEMIRVGLTAIVIKVAAMGLKSMHLGKTLAELLPTFLSLNAKYGIHVCGEGGEYESFVIDCPLWKKRIVKDSMEMIDDPPTGVAYIRLSAHVEPKEEQPGQLNLPLRPLLDQRFEGIYEAVKDARPTQITETSPIDLDIEPQVPTLGKIGNGVYATSTIISPPHCSVEDSLHHNLQALASLLHNQSLTIQNIISITLLLKDMSIFPIINPIYASYFPNPLPPSRLTISPRIRTHIHLSAIISTRPRTGLHVQSQSYWAPANIGPYSQSISYDSHTFLAGQIGLNPRTMDIVPSTALQAVISLQHIFRILRAENVDPGTIEGGIAYIVDVMDVNLVAKVWQNAFTNPARLAVVVVGKLPRDARVEWHILRCHKLMDEEITALTQVAFDEQIDDVLRESSGAQGLCLIIGKMTRYYELKRNLSKATIQTIPSDIIYSVNKGVPQRQKSCYIFMTG